MRFEFDGTSWENIEQGEKDCFLMTNGLGGYCCLSAIGSVARGDQAMLMAAKKAPNVRWHLITNVLEYISIDGKEYVLTSQRMKSGNHYEGYRYLKSFVYDDFSQDLSVWTYEVDGIVIEKSILMLHGENTVALRYKVKNTNGKKMDLKITPLIRFSLKKEAFSMQEIKNIHIKECAEKNKSCMYMIENKDYRLYVATNAECKETEGQIFDTMYFSQDERDGREEYGNAYINHCLLYECNEKQKELCIVFSDKQYEYDEGLYINMSLQVADYRKKLLSKAMVKSELGKQLVLSADAYIVNRESTQGKSIIAGYPFFEDWGRDTMIALAGATLVTGRFDECKSILQTFARYEKNGLLPNLFPEGDENPMYNSVDAPLLFINSVYEYMEYSGDYDFTDEMFPIMKEIIDCYISGTMFHIKMDSDGLITAGDDLDQLTWMDVRVGDYLPTPRHGKPVEINAYWYNALCIMEKLTGDEQYKTLAQKVKKSFLQKFWNTQEKCLKDVLSGKKDENQIRCNQIWALSMPFTMLNMSQEYDVLKKVRDELYTDIGLRTLSPKDEQFHGIYIGEMIERDKAYHQGTVWAYPLGAYYRACIKYARKCDDDTQRKEILEHVNQGINALRGWLREGCVAQIAEIYDGKVPTVSRGCFAQAWSVCELLRAVYDYEKEGV